MQSTYFINYGADPAPLPLWRASVRMALVTIDGVIAVVIIAAGMAGCADMSGIEATASLRDASSLGLGAATDPARDTAVAAEAASGEAGAVDFHGHALGKPISGFRFG